MTDNINPSHYRDNFPFEVIDLIEKMLTKEQFEGYCLGCEIKYRMRAGFKKIDTIEEDIHKSLWYNNRRRHGKG